MHISTLTSTREKNTDILKWFDLLFFILMKRFVERRLFPQCWVWVWILACECVRVCESVCGGLHVVYSGLFVFLLLPADSLNTEMNRGQWTTLNFLISAPQTNTSCCKSKTKNFKFFTLLSNVTSVSTHCLNRFFHLMRHKNATKSCFLKRQLSNELKTLLLLNVLSFIPVSVQVKNVLISK